MSYGLIVVRLDGLWPHGSMSSGLIVACLSHFVKTYTACKNVADFIVM